MTKGVSLEHQRKPVSFSRVRVIGTRVVLAVAAPLGMLLAVAPATAQTAIHEYSTAREYDNSGNLSYTAMYVQNVSKAVNDQPATGCSDPLTGDPVYQPHWVEQLGGDLVWVELGTGHQCMDLLRYHYWGWGDSSSGWHLRGYQTGVTNGTNYHFKVLHVYVSGTGWVWQYKIDGTQVGFQRDSRKATFLTTGLETYCEGCTVFYHAYKNMQYKTDGRWTDWDGDDGTAGDGMCGYWATPNKWKAAQKTNC